MKKFYLIVTLLATMLLGSCVQPDVDYNGPRTVITVKTGGDNTKDTKTSLGEKGADGIYPIYWLATDRIVMNGLVSDPAKINNENGCKAEFGFNGLLEGERFITFPYTEGSSCAADNPTVVFSATQNYVAGTFDSNAAPMCGYSATGEGTVTLQHLAGVLRFPFLASVDGTVLKQLSITAATEGTALSGEYAVNCQTGEMTAVEGATSPTVTYSFGEGLPLSTTEPTPLYIALPKGDFGSCVIAVTDTEGHSMMMKWTAKNIKPGIVREFNNLRYIAEAKISIDAMDSETDTVYTDTDNSIGGMDSSEDDVIIDYVPGIVFGYIKDSAGNPLANIPVSDGFKVVTTNEEGFYQMASNPEAYYIFYTSPAEYEIPINENGQPCFFKLYSHFHSRYDFTLTPLAGGKESRFILFGLADPQVSSDAGYTRFINEAVPKFKAHADSYSENCYGLVLGDIITMSSNTDKTNYMYQMRNGFKRDRCGMPIFYVMGNHDHNYHNATEPLTVDWRNSTTNLKAQRLYEKVFGPANFSFNRGDAHIISLRDIIFTTATTPGSYEKGFTDEQVAWLEADLANVPKDKLIVVGIHIQIFNGDGQNVQKVLGILNQYDNVHILSGHWHRNRNYEHSAEGSPHTHIYEHNISAVCGGWWSSNIAGDGAPNGYKVFEIEGNKMANWYFQGYPDGMDDRNYQMRLYRGNGITGAAIPEGDENANGTKGFYKFNFAEDVILANIFGCDTKWTVEIYENGTKTGTMTKMGSKTWTGCTYADLIGSYVWDDPCRIPDGKELSHDMWATGFQMGVLGRSEENNATFESCYTMWKGTLKNPKAKIKVVATDRFGREYECDTFSATAEGSDYTYVAKPIY